MEKYEHGTRLDKLRSILSIVGPGAFVAIGYMDPGNWETSLSAGSRFGYLCLFCILLSNICAILLQANAVKLGIVTGFDLAQQTRRHFSRNLNYLFYISAEIAIIACDIAEVIGSAVGLDLLFGIGIIPGILITGLDVFIILLGFDPNRVKPFEFLVLLVVITIGICFMILIVSSKPNLTEVLEGFLPNSRLITDRHVLNLFVAIIGATVMPHNLYLHTYLVQSKFCYKNPGRISQECSNLTPGREWNTRQNTYKSDLPHIKVEQRKSTTPYPTMSAKLDSPRAPREKRGCFDIAFPSEQTPCYNGAMSPDIYTLSVDNGNANIPQNPQTQSLILNESKNSRTHMILLKIKKIFTNTSNFGGTMPNDKSYEFNNFTPLNSHNEPRLIHHSLEKQLEKTVKYLQIDSIVSLSYAFLISVSILVVASSVFSKIEGDKDVNLVTAYYHLKNTLGPAIAVTYGIALLLSGQSSTITGTIAGQAVMCGHLGEEWGRIIKPWMRRLLTRSLAILPAVISTALMGNKSIDVLLIISQVLLSIQLPLAMWPMVWMTSRNKTMSVNFFKNAHNDANKDTYGASEVNLSNTQQQDKDLKRSNPPHQNNISIVKSKSYCNNRWLRIVLILVSSVITLLDVILIYHIFTGISD